MDLFGDTDPKKMPSHFFSDATDFDYSTAFRANIAVQYFSVCPRHWYIDARFQCIKCGKDFLWSAQEQQTWFETYRFWVNSSPRLCRDCRGRRREAIRLRQEYNALIDVARSGGTQGQKHRIIEIVDALENYFGCIPDKLRVTRDLFRKQIIA